MTEDQTEITEQMETAEEETPTVEPEVAEEQTEDDTEPDTFPREYVEKLRKESAGYRDRAKDRDDLAAALWAARVEATGRLQDTTDLPMPEDADPMDAEAVMRAVDELLARKPHLAARKVTGDVGQGSRGNDSGAVDLAGILRANAS